MRNEADTREQLIDAALIAAGWDVRDTSQVTVEEYAPENSHRRYVDYVLWLHGTPAAVIEAKREDRDPNDGREQAYQYARLLGERHQCDLPFVFFTNGREIRFHDTSFGTPHLVAGFPTALELEWLVQRRRDRLPLSNLPIATRIVERDYQLEAVRNVLESVEQRRRRLLLVMATGTGKTRTAVAIVEALTRARWAKRVLFLVDRIALRDQAVDAFREHLPDFAVWPEEGERAFQSDRRLYVTTHQTALGWISGEAPLSPFFFDLVVVDEAHRSVYDVYGQVFRHFEAVVLGLTATPKDHVDQDTFQLFECPNGLPTVAYSYAQAIAHTPPYLCPYEVLKIRTGFQNDGIHGRQLSFEDQQRLATLGHDPTDIDFEGTDLERRVTNAGTNRELIQTFMEQCLRDPDGRLPGKTIVFALSKRHARRLEELFDELYPEHDGRLARVVVSDMDSVHGRGGLLDQFKHQDLPRIAISVDMLDTGIDVREVVNLVFAKPVYSYVKFWQMIGRGTRVLEADASRRKPWCTEKERFLIVDAWGNFDYFEENPTGYTPPASVPLAVRLFRARLDALEAAASHPEARARIVSALRSDLARLPSGHVVVRDHEPLLARVREETFWSNLDDAALTILRSQVAPLLRTRSDFEPRALRFELDGVLLATALLTQNAAGLGAQRTRVVQQVSELPLSLEDVAKEADLIRDVLTGAFWPGVTEATVAAMVDRLAPLMRLRVRNTGGFTRLDLPDRLVQFERSDGPVDGGQLRLEEYRRRFEERARALLDRSPELQKLQRGEPLVETETAALGRQLTELDPALDLLTLRRVYGHPAASLVRLLRHVLRGDTLRPWAEEIEAAFDGYVSTHPTLNAAQLEFLQLVRRTLLERPNLRAADLVAEPFLRRHPRGVLGVFSEADAMQIAGLVEGLVA